MILEYDESILFDGTNFDEVVAWARERGEYSITNFCGKLMFFLPTHHIEILPGETLLYNLELKSVGIQINKVWYNKNKEE